MCPLKPHKTVVKHNPTSKSIVDKNQSKIDNGKPTWGFICFGKEQDITTFKCLGAR